MFRRRTLAAAIALLAAATVVAPTTTVSAAPASDIGAQAIANRVIGYFAQWGVYQRNYHVKNIRTSGSASK